MNAVSGSQSAVPIDDVRAVDIVHRNGGSAFINKNIGNPAKTFFTRLCFAFSAVLTGIFGDRLIRVGHTLSDNCLGYGSADGHRRVGRNDIIGGIRGELLLNLRQHISFLNIDDGSAVGSRSCSLKGNRRIFLEEDILVVIQLKTRKAAARDIHAVAVTKPHVLIGGDGPAVSLHGNAALCLQYKNRTVRFLLLREEQNQNYGECHDGHACSSVEEILFLHGKPPDEVFFCWQMPHC